MSDRHKELAVNRARRGAICSRSPGGCFALRFRHANLCVGSVPETCILHCCRRHTTRLQKVGPAAGSSVSPYGPTGGQRATRGRATVSSPMAVVANPHLGAVLDTEGSRGLAGGRGSGGCGHNGGTPWHLGLHHPGDGLHDLHQVLLLLPHFLRHLRQLCGQVLQLAGVRVRLGLCAPIS